MGFAMLVFIIDTAMKEPMKYEPPSPRNILALGKLFLINTTIINIPQNIKKAKSLFSPKKLIKNKFIKIIREWIPKSPL